MTGTEALAEAKRLAAGNQVMFRQHARDRMNERGATVRDVINAIITATIATYQAPPRDNWKLTGGTDRDGDSMTVIVDFMADLIVVTIF